MTDVLTNNATNLAVSTPKEIDLVEMVKNCAFRKSNIGETLVGNKGKRNLFSAVCADYKSLRSIAKDTRLDDETVGKINEAIKSFWSRQAQRILDYGEVVSASFDKPSAEFTEDGKRVTNVHLNAKLHSRKELCDSRERKLNVLFMLTQARKRMDNMLGEVGKHTREAMAAQALRIAALETEHARLESAFKS